MKKYAYAIFALVGLSYVGAILALDYHSSRLRPGLYDLVAEFRGDRFVLDSGLTLTDCIDSAPRHDPAHEFYTACELPK